MPLTPGGPAPYAPPAAVIAVMSGYRDRGFATPFNQDVLARAGISDSLTNRTLQSLRLLDLIDESGEPTRWFQDFKTIRGEDEYRAALKEWLYAVYHDVLQYADPTTDSPERVSEAFRGYQPDGQRGRMVTLMLGLFEYAGLIEGRPATPRKAATHKPRTTRTTAKSSSAASRADQSQAPTSPAVLAGASGLPPELVGLLQSIPSDRRWTQQRRDAFVTAFTTVLDYSIQVVPEQTQPMDDVDEIDTEDDE